MFELTGFRVVAHGIRRIRYPSRRTDAAGAATRRERRTRTPARDTIAPPEGVAMNHPLSCRTRRAERRAAPKPARIPLGDRPTYSSDEGLQ
jgi:hypothetical protein